MYLLNLKKTGWVYCRLILFLSVSAVISFVNCSTYASEPRIPVNSDEVIETLNFSKYYDDPQINILRQKLKSFPKNEKNAAELAKAYIRIARENTDVRYYGYAQNILKHWWNEEIPPVEIMLLRATLNQQKHKYEEAINDLKKLIKQKPLHSQAWLTLSIIQQVRGDYNSALASCFALSKTTASTWIPTLCYSQIKGLTGFAENSYKTQQALSFQLQSSRTGLYQWVLGITAETAMRRGKKVESEALFKKALALPLRDAYLLRIYADYLLVEKRPEEVLKLLKNEEQDSALLLRLAIAAKNANKNLLTKKYQNLLVARYDEARLRGSSLHERDEALYLLEFKGNLQKALELARGNWDIQKEPDDALILLRIALAIKSNADIQVVRKWMINTKLQDVRIKILLNETNNDL